MDFGAIRVFEALLAAAGWKIALFVLIMVILIGVAIRLAPQFIADRRARDREDTIARQTAAVALQNRIDNKDAMLEKILTNHIAHLEIQLAANREFFEVATERLSSISNEMKEARAQLRDLHLLANDVKDDTAAIRTLEENR